MLYQPLLFNTGPKIQQINGESLEFYSGSNQAYKAMTLQGSDGILVAHVGVYNLSDSTFKSDVTSASTAQALEVLKTVEPKVYKRTDLADDSPRVGFIAQDVAASIPNEWSNIVGATQAIAAHTIGPAKVPQSRSMPRQYGRTWAHARKRGARLGMTEYPPNGCRRRSWHCWPPPWFRWGKLYPCI